MARLRVAGALMGRFDEARPLVEGRRQRRDIADNRIAGESGEQVGCRRRAALMRRSMDCNDLLHAALAVLVGETADVGVDRLGDLVFQHAARWRPTLKTTMLAAAAKTME